VQDVTIEETHDWFSNDAATFGDRVAGAREAAGMSQDDLARRLGVKLKSLQNWENDLAEPRANKLQMLSGLLNVSIPWLLTGEGEGVEPPALAPSDAPLARELELLAVEMREMRGRLLRDAERLAAMERRLRDRIRAAEQAGGLEDEG
jgi:transcriptional regulator with XRE-family HTH domain